MQAIDFREFSSVVFFTGAGMSAESGVPTYRGSGGVWSQYNYEEYACQAAFDRNPEKVLGFHELRRGKALACPPVVSADTTKSPSLDPRCHPPYESGRVSACRFASNRTESEQE